jgi:hypothetical protein
LVYLRPHTLVHLNVHLWHILCSILLLLPASCSDYKALRSLKYKGGLISLWLYKENNKLWDWKNVFILHIPPWAPHTYDFVVLTSLTHPRKILLVVLQIGK